MSDWDLKTETVEAVAWKRSWRQEFFTDLGTDFKMIAHMEEVTLLPDGTTAKKQLPAVTRDITQVGADPRVQQLHAILTELINEWRLEDDAKLSDNAAHGGIVNG